MKKDVGFRWKLGMFVTAGILFFAVTIYFVGKQKNLFGSTIHLKSHFKTVSGLKLGNNVRFSGINIGTVDAIEMISDTSVMVELVIEKSAQPFIKTDAKVGISSDGLMGEKVLVISPGTFTFKSVKDNDILTSKNAIEMEDLMLSMKKSIDNVALISDNLAQFSYKVNNGDGALSKMISDEQFSSTLQSTLVNLQNSSNDFAKFTESMNNGKGVLSKLMKDEKFGKTLDSTMMNLKTGTKGLNETIDAAQNSILLKGYFKKKEKAAKQIEIKKANALKKKNTTIIKSDSTKRFLTPKDSIQ
jgi:phospholipid/cholesterol/gamma-HCH transport system substrate-binding protein